MDPPPSNIRVDSGYRGFSFSGPLSFLGGVNQSSRILPPLWYFLVVCSRLFTALSPDTSRIKVVGRCFTFSLPFTVICSGMMPVSAQFIACLKIMIGRGDDETYAGFSFSKTALRVFAGLSGSPRLANTGLVIDLVYTFPTLPVVIDDNMVDLIGNSDLGFVTMFEYEPTAIPFITAETNYLRDLKMHARTPSEVDELCMVEESLHTFAAMCSILRLIGAGKPLIGVVAMEVDDFSISKRVCRILINNRLSFSVLESAWFISRELLLHPSFTLNWTVIRRDFRYADKITQAFWDVSIGPLLEQYNLGELSASIRPHVSFKKYKLTRIGDASVDVGLVQFAISRAMYYAAQNSKDVVEEELEASSSIV